MAKNINFYGNAIISTGDKKFGSSSLRVDGSGSFLETSVTNDLNLSNLNYCVEGFFNFNEIGSGKNILISKESDDSYDYKLYYDGISSGIFWDVNGLPLVSGSAQLSTDQWYHLAATRESNHHYVWLDGSNFDGVSGALNVGNNTNEKFILGHTTDPNNVSKSIYINGTTYALTTKSYRHGYKADTLASAKQNITDELGAGWELASWEDFASLSEAQLQSAVEAFGINSSSTSDSWVGWLTKDDNLLHFETSKDSRSFNRCYFLAFHNKTNQSSFEYFDDYYSKYWALGSWISTLPYVVKKSSALTAPINKDFDGFMDSVRVSKGASRYCVDCFGSNSVPISHHTNDSYTSLLFDFEGAHGSKTTRDAASTDLIIVPPNVRFDSLYPISGGVGDLIRISGKALNEVTHVHLSGRYGDKFYVPKNNSVQSSVNPGFPTFTVYGSTGLYFELPQSVKDNELMTIVNNNNIVDTSNTNIVFESATPTDKFRITNPRINYFYPTEGVYGSTVTVEGSRVDNNTKFFFRKFETGAQNNVTYVEPLSTNILSYAEAQITVPREIIRDSLYISGGGEISKSTQLFTPLPTISGIEEQEFYIGSTYKLSGINAAEAFPMVFITGSSEDLFLTRDGVKKSCVVGITKADIYDTASFKNPLYRGPHLSRAGGGPHDTSLFGDSKFYFSENVHMLTGTICRQFIGSGNIFLVSRHDSMAYSMLLNTTGFENTLTNGNINSVTGEVISVKEVAPSGVDFSPKQGNISTLISLSGNYLLNVTGVKINDSGVGASCTVHKSDLSNLNNDVYYPSYGQRETGVYKITTNRPTMNSYHQLHTIAFNPCALPSGNSADLYLMTPNYEIKVE